jgi:carbon-monoxide dehydrogenase medium subunit
LSRIIFPQSAVNTSSSALKLANRKALEIAVVNTASMLSLDAKKRKIQSAHIALGAVGPAPILALKAADYLIGKEPSESNFLKAGEIATSECRPITDHRGSAIYRMEMVKLLVKRTLLRAWERIVS